MAAHQLSCRRVPGSGPFAASKHSKMQAESTRITTDGAEDDRIFLPDHKDNNHAKQAISNVRVHADLAAAWRRARRAWQRAYLCSRCSAAETTP